VLIHAVIDAHTYEQAEVALVALLSHPRGQHRPASSSTSIWIASLCTWCLLRRFITRDSGMVLA